MLHCRTPSQAMPTLMRLARARPLAIRIDPQMHHKHMPLCVRIFQSLCHRIRLLLAPCLVARGACIIVRRNLLNGLHVALVDARKGKVRLSQETLLVRVAAVAVDE